MLAESEPEVNFCVWITLKPGISPFYSFVLSLSFQLVDNLFIFNLKKKEAVKLAK